MNIILITIDSLRYDYFTRKLMPKLFSHMKNAFFFSNAIAGGPATYHSLSSLMTGCHWNSFFGKEEKKEKMLATFIKEKGIETIGIQSNTPLIVHDEFNEGFDIYDDSLFPFGSKPPTNPILKVFQKLYFIYQGEPDISGRLVTKKGEKAIENTNGNFFLWLHYMDTHMPYFLKNDLNVFDKRKGRKMFKGKHDPQSMSEEDLLYLKKAYTKEVERIDRSVTNLIKFLKKEDVWENTIFIFTSDHGDAFGEHGLYYHPVDMLYEENIHVPLLIRIPNMKGRTIIEPVSHLDIKPTLLDMIEINDKKMHGNSILQLMKNKTNWTRKEVLVFGKSGKVALRQNRWKFIYDTQKEEFELYDLIKDPNEKNDVFEKRNDISYNFVNTIKQKLSDITIKESNLDYSDENRDVKSRLKALGYLD